jgi:hypothetical protein
MSEQMVKGPWRVLDGYKHIGSDDFALDVCLAIDGDFADAAQLAAYAQELCDKLNDAAALRASRDELAKALSAVLCMLPSDQENRPADERIPA